MPEADALQIAQLLGGTVYRRSDGLWGVRLPRLTWQIDWAKDRMCKAETEGEKDAREAWYGYLQALHWVEDFIFGGAGEPPARGDDHARRSR